MVFFHCALRVIVCCPSSCDWWFLFSRVLGLVGLPDFPAVRTSSLPEACTTGRKLCPVTYLARDISHWHPLEARRGDCEWVWIPLVSVAPRSLFSYKLPLAICELFSWIILTSLRAPGFHLFLPSHFRPQVKWAHVLSLLGGTCLSLEFILVALCAKVLWWVQEKLWFWSFSGLLLVLWREASLFPF